MATFDINDVARRVQYTSTGQTGPFSFTFQVNASSELLVYIDDTVKTETTHYTVSLNADGTGSVTFGTATTSGELITIIGDQPLSRTTVFQVGQVNQPTTLETEFDNTLIRQQQIKEITDRSIQLKPSTGRTVTGSGTSGPLYFPYDTTVANNADRVLKFDSAGTSLELGSTSTNIDALAAIASDITTVSGISSNVTTVAGIASNVTSVASNASNINTVATNIANVNTVAGISSNVTTVAGLSTEISALSGVSSSDLVAVAALGTELATLAPIASDITTVAGVSGNVTTVAGISSDVSTVSGISANTTTVAGIASNVTTVAGISSDVSTVAGISANVTTVAGDTANIATVAGNTTNINTVATNITDVNSFANKYRIAATDPTTSLDIGDLYYDTTNDIMKVYGSSGWQNAGSSVNGTSARFQYVVTSSTTTLTGTDANGETLLYDPTYVDVYLNGVKMVNGTDVTVTSGTSVVFASAIGTSGTDYVDIIGYGTFNVASISTTSITSGTLGYARGGTGLGALGSADEVLQMNSGGTALEYGKVQAGNLDVAGNGTSGQMLTSDGDGTFSWADAPSGFSLSTLSGTTPTIDWSSATAFSQTLTGDTTYSFSNVPSGGEIELYLKQVGVKQDYLLANGGAYVTAYDASSDISGLQYTPSAYWNNDGTKMYTDSYNGSAYVFHQWDLSTAYDITTLNNATSFTSPSNATQKLNAGTSREFNGDGTAIIGAPTSGNSHVTTCPLSTAYDMTTLGTGTIVDMLSVVRGGSYSSITLFSPTAFRFNTDGTKLFMLSGYNNDWSSSYAPMITSISLSTPYDITSTKTFAGEWNNQFADAGGDGWVQTTAGNLFGIWMTKDGKYFMVSQPTAANYGKVFVWEMTTAFDLSTMTYRGYGTYSQGANQGSYQPMHMLPSDDGKWMNIFEQGTSTDSYAAGRNWRQYSVQTDYIATFPATISTLPETFGDGADPATTSYLRMVSLDGTNVLITDHKEIN